MNERERSARRLRENPDYMREHKKLSARRNRETKRHWFQRNRDKVLTYNKRWAEKNPEKVRAHNLLNSAIRYGKISREPCEVCGSTDRIHGHHDDYSKPLEVRWLCAIHHATEHPQL